MSSELTDFQRYRQNLRKPRTPEIQLDFLSRAVAHSEKAINTAAESDIANLDIGEWEDDDGSSC